MKKKIDLKLPPTKKTKQKQESSLPSPHEKNHKKKNKGKKISNHRLTSIVSYLIILSIGLLKDKKRIYSDKNNK